jgi:hypothetical protein
VIKFFAHKYRLISYRDCLVAGKLSFQNVPVVYKRNPPGFSQLAQVAARQVVLSSDCLTPNADMSAQLASASVFSLIPTRQSFP